MAIVHTFFGIDKELEWEIEIPGVRMLPRICPHCKGDLIRHGGYARKTCVPFVNRMLCKRCRRTMAVLPHFLAPYQRHRSEVREDVVRRWAEGPAYGA